MRNLKLAVAMAATALLCRPDVATATAYCGPTVLTRSLIYTDGSVKIFAPWRGDFVMICNLKANWKGIDPQLCWAWSTRIDNAISKGQKIALYYAYNSQAECATMPTYDNSPAPLYLEFVS